MKVDFEPHRLHCAVKKIQEEHPMCSEISETRMSGEMEGFIRRICSLRPEELKMEKLYLSYRRYIQIAVYISSGNYYKINHQNLIELLSDFTDERIFRLLFQGWQHLYQNEAYKEWFWELLRTNKSVLKQFMEKEKLVLLDESLMSWVASSDTAYQIGMDCVKIKLAAAQSFDNKLLAVGIRPDSILGRDCQKNFYTFCSREDYIKKDPLHLTRLIQENSVNIQKKFLMNFLNVMQRMDLTRYEDLGRLFLKQTGEYGTEKFKKYFSGIPTEAIEKYHLWQNFIKIRECFVEDEKDDRIVFWDRYAEYGEFVIHSHSQSVVIKFSRFCVVEFMRKTMGPIYIYDKDVYKSKVGPLVVTKSNQDLRSELKCQEKFYVERIQHQGDWQGKVRSCISRYGILY